MEYLKVLCFFYFTFTLCRSETYRAAVSKISVGSNKYSALIQEAAQLNVDLLLLASPEINLECCENDLISHDEVLKEVSAAAKEAHVYVVASLYEKVLCHNKEELIRSTIVFDKEGALLSLHRKPVDSGSKCNTTTSKIGYFSTDFGVTFGVIVEEDLILMNVEHIGVKNFIIVGSSIREMSFLSAKQFLSSWAFVNKANVISTKGVLSGNTIKTTSNMILAELENSGNERSVLITSPPSSFPGEDLSLYVMRPLNIEASAGGRRDTVCHGSFCCEFYVKTSVIGTDPQDVSYGLVSFEGIHQMGSQNVGVRTCALVACAALYKRTCFLGSQNNTNIKFDVITVSANFTNANSTQFPAIVTTSQAIFDKDNFEFITDKKDSKTVTAKLHDTDNVLTFGIIARDYSKDYVRSENDDSSDSGMNFTEYVSSENVQEFFDYLWIRLRVLIFIVSIYVLEMM